jgi:hypothetical protein
MQRSVPGVGATPTPLGRWVRSQLGPFTLPEEAMHSLTSSLSSHVVIETTTTIGSDGQFKGVRLGSLRMKPGMPRRDAERDLAIIRGLLRPAAKAAVAPIVATLSARTKNAGQDQRQARFAAEVMVADLSAYPIDVVQWACDYWIDGGTESKWFPSWPEMRELCERRVSPRRRLERALAWVVAGEPHDDQVRNYHAAPDGGPDAGPAAGRVG